MDNLHRSLFSSTLGSLSCFVVLIFLTTSIVLASSQIGNSDTDQLALLEIKAKIVDPTGLLSSWNKSDNFCEWYGVMCGCKHQRVTKLSLYSLNLSKTLSLYIGNLSFLRRIFLANNSITSGILSKVGHLSWLRLIFLGQNSFSGPIPSNLSYCANLFALPSTTTSLCQEST